MGITICIRNVVTRPWAKNKSTPLLTLRLRRCNAIKIGSKCGNSGTNRICWDGCLCPIHSITSSLMALGKAKSVLAPNSFLVGPGSFGVAKDFASKLINGGILDVFDGWSFHPYRWGGPESVVHDFSVLSSLLTTGGRQIPIISGEWGYSTCHEKNNPNKPVLCIFGAMPDIISRPLQGRYLARQWLINTMLRSPISIWYDWMDDSTKPLEGESNFGVVTADGKPKPAYVAAMVLQHYIFSPNQAQNFSGRLNASLTGSNKTNEALYALCFGTSSSGEKREAHVFCDCHLGEPHYRKRKGWPRHLRRCYIK